nr:odorant receptor [Semanotus bifasciatus]
MDGNHTYLAFTIRIFNILNMWPNEKRKWKFVKEYCILVVITLAMFALLADFVLQFYDDGFSFTDMVESIIAVTALCSVIYISICFMIKKQEIERLTKHIKIFEEFLPQSKIEKAEETAEFYTKIFILYGIVGNIFYACLPLLSYADCNKNRSNHMIKYGIPCGVIARYVLPFKHDFYPLAQFIMVEELFVTIIGTTIVMTVTMLVCGILTHSSANLKHLKTMIKDISYISDSTITAHVNRCVKYHITIIDFADQTNDAFSMVMLVHITWTSFIISVLGFEIIMETNYSNSFRFAMHLVGWLGMLFLVCFYGQILMDNSADIAKAVYDTQWYTKSPSIRRNLVLILLRAQRPLVLKAAGLKIMSLATFLGVLYSAYSYFTLLLKIKP